eukprot:354073-Ditylum_brightwellii.AAC.1
MSGWKNTIKLMILNGQMTPDQESIFQQQQPNGYYYHRTDSHQSTSNFGCNNINQFCQRAQNHCNQGGCGGTPVSHGQGG